jgi:hypothetical protein
MAKFEVERFLSSQLTDIALLMAECEAMAIPAPSSLKRTLNLLAALAQSLEDELALFRSMSVSFQPEDEAEGRLQ